MFEAESKRHHGGKYVGFINPSECRMGGGQICLLRLLRLKGVLQAVVNSKQFTDLKLHAGVAYILKCNNFWDVVFAFCQCNYAPMRVLRLCDLKDAMMDKLLYYTIQTRVMIEKYADDLSAKWYRFATPYIKNILDDDDPVPNSPFVHEISLSQRALKDGDSDEEEEGDADADSVASSDLDPDLADSEDEFVSEATLLSDRIKEAWKKREDKLIHDYSRAAYYLNPNPVIMDHVAANPHPEDKEACERLITKLFVPRHLVDDARDVKQSELIDTFHAEYDSFTTKSGENYTKRHIWVTAAKSDNVAHQWHLRYSGHTVVLGRLACHVCSKIGGIGNAERSWKAVKKVKKGRYTLGNEKAKKQATISSNYMAQRNDWKRKVSQTAGTLWEESDFLTLKLNKFCAPIVRAPELETISESSNVKRVFRAWCEKWERKKLTAKGDPIFEAKLVNKYGGMKWIDIDNPKMPVVSAHPTKMRFYQLKSNNRYDVLAIGDTFDVSKHEDDQDDYEIWMRENDLYCQIVEYYEQHPDPDIIIYQEGDCLSDEESGDLEYVS